MKIKKSGFTLIEIITALSMFSILVGTLMIWLNMSSICFTKGMKENTQNIRAEDAFLFIENQKQNSYDVAVSDNVLTLNMIEMDNNHPLNKKEYIKYSSGDLVIRYEENHAFQCENNIIKNIRDFRVQQDGKIIFVTIIFDDRREYTRCLKITN